MRGDLTMWYTNKGKENDVCLSSRVRVARNIHGYPFTERMTDEQAEELVGKIKSVFDGCDGWESVDFSSLNGFERASMAEKHLVSREFASKTKDALLVKNENESVYIMALEEDHVRIQCIKSGLDLESAMMSAYKAEEILDSALDIAYSEQVGYITHCPTNLGTGMRASVMLHLPAYTEAGGIRSLAFQLAKLGLTIRGMNGEGSAATASLYQISNQVTLGVSEDDILSKLGKVVDEIIAQERRLREKYSAEKKDDIAENSRRKYGIFMYAGRLSTSELCDIYSEMRLASSMGLCDVPTEVLDEMMFSCMPNTVAASIGGERTPRERDEARAAAVRSILGVAKK